MLFAAILSVISIAIGASTAPTAGTASCNSPQVVACCNGIAKNGTGLGCIFSTLNILNPTCNAGQSLACCSGSQTGLINVECVPITVVL